MPVIAKFYGIVIRMLFLRSMEARFHAFYGDNELVVGLTPLRIIQGEAPGQIVALVLAWAAKHQAELLGAWQTIGAARRPATISPVF
jgi:hypothetical protein